MFPLQNRTRERQVEIRNRGARMERVSCRKNQIKMDDRSVLTFPSAEWWMLAFSPRRGKIYAPRNWPVEHTRLSIYVNVTSRGKLVVNRIRQSTSRKSRNVRGRACSSEKQEYVDERRGDEAHTWQVGSQNRKAVRVTLILLCRAMSRRIYGQIINDTGIN